MSIDVLCLEQNSAGRDRETIRMVQFGLEAKGYSVRIARVFDYRLALLTHQPRIVFMPNPKGARIFAEVADFLNVHKVPYVTWAAEGNYVERHFSKDFDRFWGHLDKPKDTSEIYLQWSRRALDLATFAYPFTKRGFRVSGCIGFDRYSILRFRSREDWFEAVGRKYEHIVGYASFTFDRFVPGNVDSEIWHKLYGQETTSRFLEERWELNSWLKHIIGNNPDTLFVLKQHPSCIELEESELKELINLENTVLIHSELDIGDCAAACDAWLGFETTSALEAWLLGVPTLLLNPQGEGFVRSDMHKGSLRAHSLSDAEQYLDGLIKQGVHFNPYNALENVRKKQIRDIIQWDDGRNFLRACYFIELVLDRFPVPNSVELTYFERLVGLRKRLMYRWGHFLPGTRGAYWRFRRKVFSFSQIEEQERRHRQTVVDFAIRNKLSESDIKELQELNPEPIYEPYLQQ